MSRRKSRQGEAADGGDDSLVEKIDNRQILLALFIMRSSVSTATLPVLTVGDAAQDAWAAALVVTLGTALVALLIGGLGTKLSDKTPIEYAMDLLGKPLGSIVSAGFLLILLHFAATEARLYSEVLVGLFTPDTPIPFIIAVMVLLAAVAVYLGIEIIGRTVDVLAPFYVLFVVLAVLGGLTKFDARSLEPVLARGARPVLSGTLTPLALAGKYLSLAMLIPHSVRPQRALMYALASAVLAGLVMTSISVVVVGVLGPDLATKSIFPFLKALRTVNITRLVQRVEALGVISWGFGILVDLSVLLYCGSTGVSHLLGTSSNRHLIGPMAVIWVVYAVQAYDTLIDLLNFHKGFIFLAVVAATVVIPYVMLWIAYILRTHRHSAKGRDPRSKSTGGA